MLKKLEAILPDDLLRQVVVLISESAQEFHVYSVTVEATPAVAPAPKPQAHRSNPNKGKPLFRSEKPALEHIIDYLREHNRATAMELGAYGKTIGYSKETLNAMANKAFHNGKLVRSNEGLYYLPQQEIIAAE